MRASFQPGMLKLSNLGSPFSRHAVQDIRDSLVGFALT